MSSEWKECDDPEQLFRLKREGWEIEFSDGSVWRKWQGNLWDNDVQYRARPKQPKTKKVKMLCWFTGGILTWQSENFGSHRSWIRIPSEDKTVEVPGNE